MPPGSCSISDSLRLLIMHSQVQFSATVPATMHAISHNNHYGLCCLLHKLCTYKHTVSHTHTHMQFIQYYSCCWCIWDFNLTFCLNIKETRRLSRGRAPLPAPLNEALVHLTNLSQGQVLIAEILLSLSWYNWLLFHDYGS